jgi:hypothetical protein
MGKLVDFPVRVPVGATIVRGDLDRPPCRAWWPRLSPPHHIRSAEQQRPLPSILVTGGHGSTTGEMDVTVKRVTSSDAAKVVEQALARSQVAIHITESQRQAILSKNTCKNARSK